MALHIIVLLFSTMTRAEDERGARFVSVQLENDSIGRYNDGYYTHGMELAFLQGKQKVPSWLATLAGWFPLYTAGDKRRLVSYSLGQKLFTPKDKESSTVVADDRPYAGYLYTTATLISLLDHDNGVDSGDMLELTLGLVGPSALGKETQNTVHQLGGDGLAQGWDNQLQDELALGVTYSRLWRVVRPLGGGLEGGINPHLSLALGNVYTYAATGVMFRLGDNLRRDLNPPNIRPGFPGVPYYQSLPGVDWYGFAGYELRWVGRDIFLDGNSLADSHRVDKEWLVGDTQYGIVFVHRQIRLAISNMVRSREFVTQRQGSSYTAINLSWRY
jgi:lipid A 3-O-deacylase